LKQSGLKGRDISDTAMPQSLSKILVHLVFSTKNREPWIHPSVEAELHAYMVGVLENMDCLPVQIGGVEDHVHVLFGLSRTQSVAEVVEKIKVSSSKWIKPKAAEFKIPLNGFQWQSGYGAFSVSQSDAEVVAKYIRGQREHHRMMAFEDEYRKLLERFQIAYDERYVWD
jgi:REP element-mobilizing transposase RayT